MLGGDALGPLRDNDPDQRRLGEVVRELAANGAPERLLVGCRGARSGAGRVRGSCSGTKGERRVRTSCEGKPGRQTHEPPTLDELPVAIGKLVAVHGACALDLERKVVDGVMLKVVGIPHLPCAGEQRGAPNVRRRFVTETMATATQAGRRANSRCVPQCAGTSQPTPEAVEACA